MLVQADGKQGQPEDRDRGRVPAAGQTPYTQAGEQRGDEIERRHTGSHRGEPVVECEQNDSGDVDRRRLRGGDIAVGQMSMQPLPGSGGVDTI